MRLAMIGIGATTGVTLAFAFAKPAVFLIPFVLLGGLSMITPVMCLRRALSDGFHVDDLHAALREHQLVRAEEIEYERRQGSSRVRRGLAVMLAVSSAGTALGAYLWYGYLKLDPRLVPLAAVEEVGLVAAGTLFFSLTGLTISAVPLLGQFIRHRLSSRIAAASISLWKGKWGARLAKLAGIGLKPVDRPMLGMPVLTEIALGRATDHLFQALPKAARRELSALPETVRRLEADASKLRASIDALDDQLAAFERGGDALHDDARSALAEELAAARALSAERLTATVSALESIRLDLLRLQMGSAKVESVTATLDAARQIGDRIGESIAANIESIDCSRAAARSLARSNPSTQSSTKTTTPTRQFMVCPSFSSTQERIPCRASSSSRTADFIALQRACGEYSLDREIGRGGMGVVYLAREVRLARQVAIKVLPPALAARAELREAFLREAQMVAGSNHPNIVPVHASGERDGYVYIVMAFIEGITLANGFVLAVRCCPDRLRACCAKWPGRSATRTPRASCIATSPQRTSSSNAVPIAPS